MTQKSCYLFQLLFVSLSVIAVSSCRKATLHESIVYEEASDFTIITDTLWLDMTKLVKDTTTQHAVIETIVRQRDQYKMLVSVANDKWERRPLLSTLTHDLEPLYDTLTWRIPSSAYWGRDVPFLDIYADATQNDALILPFDSVSEDGEKRECNVQWNSETNSRKLYRYRDMPCYHDDSVRVEYQDVGEFGHFVTFYSTDSTRYNCISMPINRLLRWHGIYYGIASSHIYKIEDPFAEGPVNRMPNEGRWYSHDSVFSCLAVSVPSLELNNSWHSNAYCGWCDVDTMYQTAFIRNDQLYIVESRPNDGLYLMKLDDEDHKSEVLRICDFVYCHERINTKYVNLYPSSYAILQFRDNIPPTFTVTQQGFIEFCEGTIRVVYLR